MVTRSAADPSAANGATRSRTPDSAFCRSRSIRESDTLRLQSPVGELQGRRLLAPLKIPGEAHDKRVARRLALLDPGIHEK